LLNAARQGEEMDSGAAAVSAGEPVASAAAPGIGSVLSHDRGGRFEPNAHGAALVDKDTLGGNAPDDILRVNIGAIGHHLETARVFCDLQS
jgi:hypothetical protein